MNSACEARTSPSLPLSWLWERLLFLWGMLGRPLQGHAGSNLGSVPASAYHACPWLQSRSSISPGSLKHADCTPWRCGYRFKYEFACRSGRHHRSQHRLRRERICGKHSRFLPWRKVKVASASFLGTRMRNVAGEPAWTVVGTESAGTRSGKQRPANRQPEDRRCG